MNEQEFNAKLDRAKKRVARMDLMDGWRDREPATIAAALELGMRKPETNAHFEALAMIQDVAERQRQEARR